MPLLTIGHLNERMRDRLSGAFDLVPLPGTGREAFLAEHGGRFAAVATLSGLPPEVAEALPNLRIVSSFGVGYDSIDAAGLASRGVVVTNTPDVLNNEVADTAIMLWLAVSRHLIPQEAWARSGKWKTEGNAPLTRSIRGRRVGILGLGRIGQTIARLAQAFDAEIHYTARSEKDVPFTFHPTPEDLARAVDVLIVITPGGEGTRNIVDAAVLKALGPDGILINVARGTVVDEPALIAALRDGTIAGAGLDVFAEEPAIPDALKTMENVVLLPHVGSATHETRAAMGDLVCDNLLTWARDGTPLTPVPESAGVAPTG